MPFELTLDGHTYNTDLFLLSDAVELEKALGRTWRELNPLGSAEEFTAFALMALKQDHPPEVAEKIVATIPLGAALAAARWIDSDLPDTYEDGHPKAEAAPSTTMSSGTPAHPTDGPRT